MFAGTGVYYVAARPPSKGLRLEGSKDRAEHLGVANLDGADFEEVFQRVARPNHGADRVSHGVKYDLTGFAQLVTVMNNELCLFLYAGDHDTKNAWMGRNKGLDFVAKQQSDQVLESVFRRLTP